jgi:hypothetical protein
MGERVKVYG